METNDAAHALSTLGHPGRLAVFRLLMRFAPRGVRPTEIAEALDLKANTLSHHLSDLAAAGLVRAERQGRNLFYAVAMDRTEALVGYLALDLGRGRPQLLSPLHSADQPAENASDRVFTVLFLCTGNSARSLMAEAILRDLGQGRFRALSAGTTPRAEPHPMTLTLLRRNDHDVTGLRAKPVSELRQQGAPALDFVFTVCDSAASEDCPPWPGQPISAHWGLPDPARAEGTEAERALAFARTYAALHRRITAFTALPLATLDRLALQDGVDRLSLLT
ncbi:ArsR family transcriptional regulator [Pararhodobacter marinus]|uniref:ArsR family transcriptional regulator n=1 Tax=Pararhodobacter marinus TaxID=2184063 RepID=A0A2U2CCA5_9RHOB|nr:metalloregulator ArsR/SmtB family transcription factor [Pararhodobacter marinus]PWE29490.1 ArsR family transcriptional regulator [Pararhodobacter marinus]